MSRQHLMVRAISWVKIEGSSSPDCTTYMGIGSDHIEKHTRRIGWQLREMSMQYFFICFCLNRFRLLITRGNYTIMDFKSKRGNSWGLIARQAGIGQVHQLMGAGLRFCFHSVSNQVGYATDVLLAGQ